MYSSKKPNKRHTSIPRYAILSVIVTVAVLAIGAIAIFASHKGKPQSAANSASQQPAANNSARLPSSASPTTPSNSGEDSSAKSPDTPAQTSGAAPKAPFGDFVSNHKPSLTVSGFSSNVESSVCNTTPGAACVVGFSQNGVTKSLGSQTADASGAVYWNNWTLQSIGLTAGTWSVTATASQNGHTVSASDPTSLQVQP